MNWTTTTNENLSQREPAPTNALVGHSVHRIGWIFYSAPDPALTNIVSQVPSFGYWALTFFFLFLGRFFSDPDLDTTLPPSHPAELYLDLICELTINTPYLPTHTTYLHCSLTCTFRQNLELFFAKPLFGKTFIILWLNFYFLIKLLYFSY